MIRRPLTEGDFSSSKWQTQSTVVLGSDAHPGSLKLNILGSNPFDLTSVALPSPLSTNNTIRSHPYPPFNPILASTTLEEPLQQDTTVSQDDIDQDDKWITAATTSKPKWNRLASWDDRVIDDEDDIEMVDATNPEKQVSVSPFLTESNDCIEALYQTKYPDTVVVDQERMINDVIYLLTGVPSLCFEWKQQINSRTKGKFQTRTTRIRLADVNADTVQHLLKPMMLFGTRMKHLDHFIHDIQSNPSMFGLIATSFASCLGELISYLQYSILSLFSSTTATDNQPLLAIHYRMEGFYLIMDHLTDLCSTDGLYSIPRGSDLMSLIYNKAQHMDDLQIGYLGFVKAIYMTLLINTTAPWLSMITQWLNEGSFYDPYKEFFIITKRTALNPSALPCFLPLETSKMILRAGMSIEQHHQSLLPPFYLSWLDPSYFPLDTPDKHSYPNNPPLDHPPTFSGLSHPDTHLQKNRPSVITLQKWTSYQENNYVPPLTVLLQQQIIDPIQYRCHSISDPSPPPSLEATGRRDLMFTYWNGHAEEHPTTFYTDIVSPPFTIANFLLEQRQKQTSRQ